MALTTLVRYWEGDSVPESAIKMLLKRFSRTDENISLNYQTTFLDIDDAARSLGYEVSIVRAEQNGIIALIKKGIPVAYPISPSVCVAWGYDAGRSTLLCSDYSRISSRTIEKARKESDVILTKRKEGHGRNSERTLRIAIESRSAVDLSLTADTGRPLWL
jgi:hypothetical protein